MAESKKGVFTFRIRLAAVSILPTAIVILFLAFSGRFWPDNHTLFILVACLVAVLMVILILRSFSQPITHLIKAAERITLGDLWSQVPVTRDEFGLLANAINTMTSELHRIETGTDAMITKQASELANVLEQSNQWAKQYRAITEVTQAIVSSDSNSQGPEAVFRSVSEIIGRNFGFTRVGIYTVDGAGEQAVLQAIYKTGAIGEEKQPFPAPGDRLDLKTGGLISEVIRVGEVRTTVQTDPAGQKSQDSAYSEPAGHGLAAAISSTQIPDTHSEIVLPVKINARVIGAIDLHCTEQLASGEDARGEPSRLEGEFAGLSALASQVAIAAASLENARLFREYSSSLAEIQALHRQTLQEAWTKVAFERKKSGYIYQNGKLSPLVEDPGEKNRSGSGIPLPGSLLEVPITVRGQVIGMLNLSEPGLEKGWTEEEINLVKTVADQVGLAMENARLLEETLRRAEREHLVSEITTRLRASNDPDAILQTAASELRRVLRAARAQVLSPQEKQAETFVNPQTENTPRLSKMGQGDEG